MKVNLVCHCLLAGKDKGKEMVFGRVKCSEKILFKQFCEKISTVSAATRGDVELVINGFLEVMKEQLAMGHIVKLGELGNFRLTAGSHGADTEEGFYVSMIKKPRLIFSPGIRLRDALKKARFEYMGTKTEMVDEDCLLPHA